MSNYRRGYELELEVKALFERDGWAVLRGSSSKGNVMMPEGAVKADLIASKISRDKRTIYMVLCQAKRVRG